MLALLVEHRVPLPDAILLAAQATGGRAMIEAGQEIAGAVRRGDSLHDSLHGSRAVPPLLRWLIVTGEQHGALAPALRHAAETYRRRALHQADLVRVALPPLLVFAVGVTATLVYALTLFVPFTTLLKELSGE